MGKKRAVVPEEQPGAVREPSSPMPADDFWGLLTTALNAVDDARLAAVHREIEELTEERRGEIRGELEELSYRLDALRGKV